MYIKFLNAKTPIKCAVKQIAPNVVELRFDDEIIVNTKGFRAYLDEQCEYDIGGDYYTDFTTVYRNDETTVAKNGYQLSNDGTVYVKPYSIVTFNASVGGTLDGTTTQEVYKYEELVIPTPIADTDYEFTSWNKEIPTSGDVEGNQTFTAVFTSTLPTPDPEPTVEERLEMVEAQNQSLALTVDSIMTDIIPTLM